MSMFFSFSIDVMQDLHDWVNPKNGKHSPMIAHGILEIMRENADVSMSLGWIILVQGGLSGFSVVLWGRHSPMIAAGIPEIMQENLCEITQDRHISCQGQGQSK